MENNIKHIHKFCDLLESVSDEQMYLIFVSCLSADIFVNASACKHSLYIIDDIIEALDEAEISDIKRTSWLNYATRARNIILQDLENFENQNNGK